MYLHSTIKEKRISITDVQTKIVPITFLPENIPHGYANGYIGVIKGHPWYEKHHGSIECNIHGGLTFSGFWYIDPEEGKLEEYWWIGFDTCHSYDNKFNCT